MPIFLRQSTASQEIPLGYFVDSTDGDTAETALTIANTDIKVWKTGATTLASKNSGGATHIAGGVYYCTLDATDTDTIGPLVVFVHVSGALSVRVECCVLDENVYDVQFGTTAPSTHAAADVWSVATRVLTAGTNLNDISAAEVNAEVVDALATDTYAEPGQGAPGATTSLAAKINYLYKAWRNKSTQTSTTYSLYDDAGTTVDQKSTVSDDSTTFTKGEIATGP